MTNEVKDKADDKPEKAKKKPEPRRPGGKEKRGPNKWLLRIFRGYDAGGKRIYYSETFIGGSKDADNRLIELRNRHKAGLPLKFEAKTFKDFFDKWIEDIDDGERREETIRVYRRQAEAHLLPAFGKMALTDITSEAISRLYKQMRGEEYAAKTISLLHTILVLIFNAAEKAELVLRNPMRNVKGPKLPKPAPVAMGGEEVHAFLEAAQATPDGFMFALAYFLGARPCEYLGLKWTDCDKKNQRITIQRSLKWRKPGDWYLEPPKTEKSVRTIPVTPDIARGLDAQRKRQLEAKMKAGAAWTDTGFIFTDEAGEPLQLTRARYLHKKILDAAGLPETFHLKVSRHTCASAMLKAGVHPKIVSERLGHARIATTLDIYTQIEEEQHRDASERIGNLFGIGKK